MSSFHSVTSPLKPLQPYLVSYPWFSNLLCIQQNWGTKRLGCSVQDWGWSRRSEHSSLCLPPAPHKSQTSFFLGQVHPQACSPLKMGPPETGAVPEWECSTSCRQPNLLSFGTKNVNRNLSCLLIPELQCSRATDVQLGTETQSAEGSWAHVYTHWTTKESGSSCVPLFRDVFIFWLHLDKRLVQVHDTPLFRESKYT